MALGWFPLCEGQERLAHGRRVQGDPGAVGPVEAQRLRGLGLEHDHDIVPVADAEAGRLTGGPGQVLELGHSTSSPYRAIADWPSRARRGPRW